mmetsp:Transcript_96455/g.269924  ORF Transcript_96455/g.269924 Transcript_96455/m.269924 type:complete len:257 (+) Transcript_96455:136-906(+)
MYPHGGLSRGEELCRRTRFGAGAHDEMPPRRMASAALAQARPGQESRGPLPQLSGRLGASGVHDGQIQGEGRAPTSQGLREQMMLLADLTQRRGLQLAQQHRAAQAAPAPGADPAAQNQAQMSGQRSAARRAQNGTGPVPPQRRGLPSHPGHVPPSAWRTARARESVAEGLASSTWPPPPTPPADDRRGSRRAAHQRALHRRGGCSPCFFHLNGVCQFGSGCFYCHEPHDETSWRRRRAPKFMRVALRARQAPLAV